METRSNGTFEFKPFSKKQRQVLNWWTPDSPVSHMDGIIADGAIRSGKSTAMALGFVIWAMECFNGVNFAMCGKTIQSFRRNVWSTLRLQLTSCGYSYTERITENLILIRKGNRENAFYLFGGRDERSQDLIQGITIAGLYCDEVVLMPESFVSQATARCSVEGSRYWFNCNPGSPLHWFKKEYIDKQKDKRLLYLHFVMDDNLSLSEKIKERYRRQYSGVFYDRYILGLWKIAEGLIYDMFDEDCIADVDHILSEWQDKKRPFFDESRTFVSCDYGTQNATVFLLWQYGADGRWYVTREYYYSGADSQKQKTNAEFARDLKEWLGDTRIRYIVVDPAAASFKTDLRRAGFSTHNAKNTVLDGIEDTATMYHEGTLKISRKCENTIREMYSYAWDKKAADRGEDKPIKKDDHCADALRYGVEDVKKTSVKIGNKPRGL